MRKFLSLLCLAMMVSSLTFVSAANQTQSVTQVTSSVALTTAVDYTITGDTPFAASGSVDIQNLDHAVVIIKSIKPSQVISKWLQYVKINGEQAVNGKNCQVKMFGRGTIIFPYASDFKPLTCYTERNFQGTSYNNYTEGHSGGFMKTLSAEELNNKIRSFKLKRGYMVTFALGKSGWGYSRCFIADMEDLEMNMPDNMDARVSSYRIFKWHNAHKAGLASNGSAAANQALNTSWCYDWAQGNDSNLPDTEWVPNHIYEDWPSASSCGSVTGSCHMKTNNEPGNSADDHPQDVATVLGNWQNLMRTGMRLCSETSHDGSWNHLKEFIEEIDKRGWRCDILDLHCYWASGFDNLAWYSSNYGNGRPIWISEWIWGASWNKNGCWGNGVTDTQILNQTKNILTTLNNSAIVERYAYWNSESKGHIYENGKLTALGEYYATMDVPMAYNAKNEYVPKVVYTAPTGLRGAYDKAKSTYTLTWNDSNGDMLDSLTVECKQPGTSQYAWIGNVALQDNASASGASYSFVHNLKSSGSYYYRVCAYPIGSKTPKYSTELVVNPEKDGVFYLYDSKNKGFLARGAKWGTQAVVDKYGVPFNWNSTLGNIEFIDYPGRYLFIASDGVFTDTENANTRTWEMEASGNGYYLYNTTNKEYATHVSGEDIVTTTKEKSQATVWTLMLADERNSIVNAYAADNKVSVAAAAGLSGVTAEDFEKCLQDKFTSKDYTDKVGTAKFSSGAGKWTWNQVRGQGNQPDYNDKGAEAWQATGSWTQTISGLSSGIYKVTVDAFERRTNNVLSYTMGEDGYANVTSSYLKANDEQVQLASWYDGVVKNGNSYNPNTMSEAAAAFGNNKYDNEVYTYVGSDGTLTLSVVKPNYTPDCWLIFNNVTLTYYEGQPVLDDDEENDDDDENGNVDDGGNNGDDDENADGDDDGNNDDDDENGDGDDDGNNGDDDENGDGDDDDNNDDDDENGDGDDDDNNDDEPDSITELNAPDTNADVILYNIMGQQVGKNYKGIVIDKNGKKYINHR